MTPDFSMFSAHDAFDILLQRTTHLKSALAFKLWARGISWPLKLEATIRRDAIITGAFGDAQREFSELANFFDSRGFSPRRIADIGCGHGLIDLLFAKHYSSALHLIDIERTEKQHHDFNSSGAGYASLDKARAFLESNGVAGGAITTSNPQKSLLKEDGADLIISLLSCGFHYPAETYGPFIDASLSRGGLVVMDIRKDSGQDEFLRRFSAVETVHETDKYRRIAARRD